MYYNATYLLMPTIEQQYTVSGNKNESVHPNMEYTATGLIMPNATIAHM